MDTIKRHADRFGAAVRPRIRWPITLACVAVLLVPAFAGAEQLEELKNSIRQGVSDAVRQGSDSARKAVDPASGAAPPPASQPAATPPPKGDGAHAPAGAQSAPPAPARSSSACTSLRPAERAPWVTVLNTCTSQILLLLEDSHGRCVQRPLHAGRTTSAHGESQIRAVCRRTAVAPERDSCRCPAGTELSGSPAAEVASVAGSTPTTAAPAAAPAPPAAAQESNPGLFGGVLAAITKNSDNTVQNEIDRTVNRATGGAGGSVGGSSSGSSNSGSSTGSGGSAAPANSGPSHVTSAQGTLTQAEIDYLAKSDYEQCAIHTTYLKNLHDCTCRSEAYRQVLNGKRSKTLTQEEQNRRGQTCPAPKATTYAWVYQACDDSMQHKRTDHAQFCGCTAERFSSTFHERPDSNLRKVEELRKNSMIACGVSDKSHNIHGAK